MKSKLMFLMAILFCLGFSTYAQDVDVTNDMNNVNYGIVAVYVYGVNQKTETYAVTAGGTTTINEICSSNNNYTLSTFTVKTTSCQSSIAPTHTYNTASSFIAEDCNECDGNAYSNYTINGQVHDLNIRCRD
ncbi:MAG: hypothetical protein U9R19_03840 [Bacteroidota bacterium]|nr:hypothetical protein [Bacteroidota bacterium]